MPLSGTSLPETGVLGASPQLASLFLIAGCLLGVVSTVLFSCFRGSKREKQYGAEKGSEKMAVRSAAPAASMQQSAWQGMSQQPVPVSHNASMQQDIRQTAVQSTYQTPKDAFAVNFTSTAMPSDTGLRRPMPTAAAGPPMHAQQQTVPAQAGSDPYQNADLDDDWKSLLSDLDDMLMKQGASRMSPQERSMAIKKVMETTGSRGPAFALSAVKDAILRSRNPFAPAGQVPTSQKVSKPAAPPQHKHKHTASGLDMKDQYHDGDLDDDWKTLLAEVDGMLRKQGAASMSEQERSVAIKKLIQFTGTRGPVFALSAVTDSIVRSRNPFS